MFMARASRPVSFSSGALITNSGMFTTLISQTKVTLCWISITAAALGTDATGAAMYICISAARIWKTFSAAVDYLKTLRDVDTNRLGIWGVSYGGFMTNMALFLSPGTFKAGSAWAAVNDWENYNAGYTIQKAQHPGIKPGGLSP